MIKKIKQLIKSRLPNMYQHYMLYKHAKKQQVQFENDLQNFEQIASLASSRFDNNFDRYPMMEDKTEGTLYEPHYIYHPAWAARILAETKPEKHVDISSTLNFCSLVSAFIPIDFYDYRPAILNLSNLSSKHADLTNLHFEDNSIQSLSCMHTIEHIGLGRYGDQFDYDGDLKAISELIRVLAVGGNLLMVTPIGIPKIAFNAHRIYAFKQFVSYFSKLELVEFSLVPDNFENIGLIKNATAEIADQQHWGCGCFWFKKTKL